MRGTNQGGSLVGFISIGVLLALVLVGGLYGLNRYNAQKAADETVAVEEDKTKTTTQSEEKSEPAKTEQTADKTRTDDTKETKPGPQAAQPSATSSTATQLPQTGPADTVFNLIAGGLLAFAAVHYARSRVRG